MMICNYSGSKFSCSGFRVKKY